MAVHAVDQSDQRNGSRSGPFILPEHRRELSAIAEDVIAERGYRTIGRPTPGNDEPRRELERLRIPRWAHRQDTDFPGLLIPMYGPTGQRANFQ